RLFGFFGHFGSQRVGARWYQPRRAAATSLSSLLPLWEKVAIGGLRPPFLRTPMFASATRSPRRMRGLFPRIETPLRFAKRPSPTRGEGRPRFTAFPSVPLGRRRRPWARISGAA